MHLLLQVFKGSPKTSNLIQSNAWRKGIFISQLILESLYESLGLATEVLRNLQPKVNLLLFGSFWLLQLWLNATFEISLDIGKPNNTSEAIRDICIKGIQLTKMTPTDKNRSNREAFPSYFLIFSKLYHFNPTMAPFSKKNSCTWVVYSKVPTY